MNKLDKERIAACFLAGSQTYDEAAVVQREVSGRLMDCLAPYIGAELHRVLEIGCCTGILTEMLCRRYCVHQLYLNDLVDEFCLKSESRISGLVDYPLLLPGDIESHQLPSELDLVISSSTLQWIASLPELFGKIASALNQGGLLAFSIFTDGTMKELHSLTGSGLTYMSAQSLTATLAESFDILVHQSAQHRLFFPTVRAILRHVRETGVGGVDKKSPSFGKLKELHRLYRQRFQSADGLPVTYVSMTVVARRKENK